MARPYPRAGAQYPRSLGEFHAWFQTDADCLDYLEWLRWPSGFVCPACDNPAGWRTGDGRIMCAGCGSRTSVTAGTIFDRTRTPLTVWFAACWHFATGKDGISALSLKRTLEIGSYQTVWAILHRLRSVLVRPGRELLSGKVEVDETYIGGAEPGLSGGRARGKKVLTAIAVEIFEPKGWGRCRMAPIADASASSRECPNFCVRGLVSLTHHWARDCKRRAIATARPRSPDCSLVRSRCLFLRPDLPSSWRPRPAVSNPPSSAGPEPRAATAWERAWRGPTICHGRARPPCWTQVAMAARSVTAVTKRGPHSCDAVQVEIDDLLKRLRCGTGAQTFR